MLLLAGGGVWWWRKGQAKPVEEYQVKRESVQETLRVSGSLTAQKQADLRFQAGGRLAWVGVKEGDWVRQWQGIAALDQRTLQKSLEKELNDYLVTRWNFEGDRETYNVTSDDLDDYTLSPAARRVLEKSQFTLNNAVLEVEIQVVSKELATMVAPFSGLVAKLLQPNPGVNVTATEVVATIVDPKTMYFRAEVDEVDLGEVRVGQKVKLNLDAYPDEVVETGVSEVGFAPVTLSGGGTGYEVKMDWPMDNGDLRHKLGMNGEAVITLSEKEGVLVLPVEAVVEKNDESLVRQRVGGKIIEKKVTIGLQTEDKVEIVAGLNEGDVVVDVKVKK